MAELKEYRIFVDSRRLTDYKSHNLLVQLDREFKNCVDLKLVNISLCNSFYNITNKTIEHRAFLIFDKGKNEWSYIYLKPGLYNLDTLAQEINGKAWHKLGSSSGFSIRFLKSESSDRIKIRLSNNEKHKFMVKKPIANLLGILPDRSFTNIDATTPNSIPYTHFYIFCNLIDPTKTFEATKDITCNSGLLNILPLKNVKEFGTKTNYNLTECDFKPCIPRFNNFRLEIRNPNGYLIDLNNFPVIYELVIRCRE